MVHGLEPLFVPLSLLACAIRPLIDAALDLITVDTIVKIRGPSGINTILTTASIKEMAGTDIGEKCS